MEKPFQVKNSHYRKWQATCHTVLGGPGAAESLPGNRMRPHGSAGPCGCACCTVSGEAHSDAAHAARPAELRGKALLRPLSSGHSLCALGFLTRGEACGILAPDLSLCDGNRCASCAAFTVSSLILRKKHQSKSEECVQIHLPAV